MSPLDKYIKSCVVEDAIIISCKKISKQFEIGEGNHLNGFKQLICGSSQIEEMNIFNKTLKIYEKLSGCMFKEFLTSSKFGKLSCY